MNSQVPNCCSPSLFSVPLETSVVICAPCLSVCVCLFVCFLTWRVLTLSVCWWSCWALWVATEKAVSVFGQDKSWTWTRMGQDVRCLFFSNIRHNSPQVLIQSTRIRTCQRKTANTWQNLIKQPLLLSFRFLAFHIFIYIYLYFGLFYTWHKRGFNISL